jgi:hypothetical protein
MKLTKRLLVELINEAMEHGGLSCNEVHPEHTHSEWEDHKKEEEIKTKAMAKISIKPSIIVENEGEDSVSKAKVQKLYTNWKPTTDEGKLYKKQLGKVLEK